MRSGGGRLGAGGKRPNSRENSIKTRLSPSLSRADYLIGHNIAGYDLPLLRRLYGWMPSQGCVVVDTLTASRLILPHLSGLDGQAAAMGDPPLGKLTGRHSLEAWGARLGLPKAPTSRFGLNGRRRYRNAVPVMHVWSRSSGSSSSRTGSRLKRLRLNSA
jgi:hypothetical protein